jgi:hypothetical protein
MKMAFFWVITPCSLVEVYQRFRGTCCLHYQGLNAACEAASNSETLVNFYQTTRHYNPEDSNLLIHNSFRNLSLLGDLKILVIRKEYFSNVL